jgi:hypothetical protein
MGRVVHSLRKYLKSKCFNAKAEAAFPDVITYEQDAALGRLAAAFMVVTVVRDLTLVLLTGLGFVRNTRPLWANFLHPLMNLNILA